ncbi:MAG: hypothetical protein D6752_01435, partial [Candidatus Nitrosothermus koennekii]
TIEIDTNKGVIHNLAVYIMERLQVVAAIKHKAIDIDPIIPITIDDLIDTIKNFLSIHNIEGIVSKEGNKIKVTILSNIYNEYKEDNLLICPHCGKVSKYEEEMMVHIRAHYIGF